MDRISGMNFHVLGRKNGIGRWGNTYQVRLRYLSSEWIYKTYDEIDDRKREHHDDESHDRRDSGWFRFLRFSIIFEDCHILKSCIDDHRDRCEWSDRYEGDERDFYAFFYSFHGIYISRRTCIGLAEFEYLLCSHVFDILTLTRSGMDIRDRNCCTDAKKCKNYFYHTRILEG